MFGIKFDNWFAPVASFVAPVLTGSLVAGAKGAEAVGNYMDEASGAKAARDASAANSKAMLDSTNRLIDESRKRAEQQEADSNATATRNSARARQRALASGAQGRRDTILTSPLGVPNAPQQSIQKTLLGQ